ncbi:MAG: hypothetical protein BHV99_01255 [Clostridium sp. 26_21]|nr:MAG: hypothetical protein BHV99_01255 [Clostridium sp. 26_21]
MEQSKWVIVRRETGFEKFKRSIKNILAKIFGIKENSKDVNKKKVNKSEKNNEEITIEILV